LRTVPPSCPSPATGEGTHKEARGFNSERRTQRAALLGCRALREHLTRVLSGSFPLAGEGQKGGNAAIIEVDGGDHDGHGVTYAERPLPRAAECAPLDGMRVRRPLRVALCVALLTGVQRGDAADTLERGPAPLGRLPGDVRPTHYALELTVRPDAKRFSGMVRIQITLDRQQRVIWLHGADLDVSEAVLEAPGGERAARWEQVDRSGVV